MQYISWLSNVAALNPPVISRVDHVSKKASVSRYFRALCSIHLCKNMMKKITILKRQPCLKHVLLLMGDTVGKDGTHLTADVLTEGHLLSCLCQLDVLRALCLALPPSSLLLTRSLCAFLWRLIGRSRLRHHPAWRAQTLVVILSGRLGGLVSLHAEMLHSIPKVNCSCGSRVGVELDAGKVCKKKKKNQIRSP